MASDLGRSALAERAEQRLLVRGAPVEAEMPVKPLNAVLRLPYELGEAKVEKARVG